MRLMKRALLIALCLLVLLLLAAGGVAGWYLHKTGTFLVPPPDPADQPSIASRVELDPDVAPPATPLFSPVDWNTLADPPKSTRPWTRWWWPGGDVDPDTLVSQMDTLDAAGFGGAEIQPFLSGMMTIKDAGTWDRVYSFDKPGYHKTVDTLMTAADARGWQLDLTHFSGWPPGGPEVNLDDSLTVLAWSEADVHGGSAVELALPRPAPGPSELMFAPIEFAGADFLNFPADHARVLSVVAARVVDGEHAWSPFNLADTVTLDPSSVQVLDAQVRDGVLRWSPPAGDWHIVTSWLMPSGEAPMGAAQRPQGFVIDHLRRQQVLGHYAWAFGNRTGLQSHYGRAFRGFFNDSLEFRVKRMGVEDILSEFRARRGYDLAPWLPVIHQEGKDNVYLSEIVGIKAAPEFAFGADDARIRHDYQQTLSDLVIERFVETSADWATARGLSSRGQSYGMEIDLLRALGANTIPETEQLWGGGSHEGLRMASSAAALYGRPLVSAESFVWIMRDWTTTARKVKAAADKLFLSGVNHVIWHGTPYPWTGGPDAPYGDEGWSPFSGPGNPAHFSSVASPADTQLWPDMPDVNRYIARSQNLLRQGSPVIDVLIYYPFLGFNGANPADGGTQPLLNGSVPDADPPASLHEDPGLAAARKTIDAIYTVPPKAKDPREVWLGQVQALLRELERRGITWGWVNDHALQQGKVGARTLPASGGRFSALLVAAAPTIEPGTLETLGRLHADGVPVVFAGALPERQPGFRDAAAGDAAVRSAISLLHQRGVETLPLETSRVADALQAAVDSPVKQLDRGTIESIRRTLQPGQDVMLFANQAASPATTRLAVPPDAVAWWFDAQSGAAWSAIPRDGSLSLSLRGFESRFLMLGVPLPASFQNRIPDSVAASSPARSWPLSEWTLATDGAAARPVRLGDWRDDPSITHAGIGQYDHAFSLRAKPDAIRYLLDVGLVQGSARVKVNGKDMGRASLPPFLLDISSALSVGENRIEVDVHAPLRNVFVGRALAGDKRYSHMKAYEGQVVAAGLVGPVSVLEINP